MIRLGWLVLCVGSAAGAAPGDLELPWLVCEQPTAWEQVVALPPVDRQSLVERLVAEGLVQAPRAQVPAGLAADARAAAETVEVRLRAARVALVAGDTAEAVELLRPVAPDPRVAPFWQEAVDAHVYAERERAGRIVAAAGAFPTAVRIGELRLARDLLAGLAEDYPESVYAEPVLDALSRVEHGLDQLVP